MPVMLYRGVLRQVPVQGKGEHVQAGQPYVCPVDEK
jgi:hypothetical protein